MLPVNAGSVKDLNSQKIDRIVNNDARLTRSKQLSTVAILGFQFGLYHVIAPLSFLRSISLASLFTTLFILSPRVLIIYA